MRMKTFLLILFLFCFFSLAFKENQYIEAQDKPVQTMASISPIADLVAQVGGEKVNVYLLVPNGVSPHTFDPRPSDIKKLEDSDFFFIIGLGLEMYAYDMIQAVGNEVRLIELGQVVPILNGEQSEHHTVNPHIWVSLRNLPILAEKVAEVLSSKDPEHSDFYYKNADEYAKQCHELDEWFTQEAESFKNRYFISAHSAWVYLARDYHLVQAGVLEETPGKEPSPKKIKSLIDSIKSSEIPVVFAEPQLSQKAAQVLADEVGVKVAILDPLGWYPETPFLETMKDNLKKIKAVMK